MNRIKASWGGFSFWVISIRGTNPRRIVTYDGTYRDGSVTDDLGRSSRREILTASLTELEYLKLETLANARIVRLFTHPIFGSFPARLNLQSYDFSVRDRGNVQIEVIEEGSKKLSVSESSAEKSAEKNKSLWNDAYTKLDNIDDKSTELEEEIETLNNSWMDLYTQTLFASTGDASWEDVDRSLNDFNTTSDAVISRLREEYTESNAWSSIDFLLRSKDAVKEFIDLTKASPVDRVEYKVLGNTDIYSLAYSIYGHGDYVQDIISHNKIHDPFFIELGTVLELRPW